MKRTEISWSGKAASELVRSVKVFSMVPLVLLVRPFCSQRVIQEAPLLVEICARAYSLVVAAARRVAKIIWAEAVVRSRALRVSTWSAELVWARW